MRRVESSFVRLMVGGVVFLLIAFSLHNQSEGIEPSLQQSAASCLPHEPIEAPSIPAKWSIKLIGYFQELISPLDSARCSLYPTCSEFARQAIEKHGLLMGIILTCDRLLHEYGEPKVAKAVIIGGRVRYLDPVEANDFWWHRR